ncbi:MAG: hypothetical protein RSD36_10770 [Terrisporobacter sp.]
MKNIKTLLTLSVLGAAVVFAGFKISDAGVKTTNDSNNINYNIDMSLLEKDLKAIEEGKYNVNWEDELEVKYGDDWDDALEAKYGDNWDDEFEAKIERKKAEEIVTSNKELIGEIEKDLENIKNGNVSGDWEDKLEAKYGDDWEDLLEAKYGDDWDDKFEQELSGKYPNINFDDDHDSDDCDDVNHSK